MVFLIHTELRCTVNHTSDDSRCCKFAYIFFFFQLLCHFPSPVLMFRGRNVPCGCCQTCLLVSALRKWWYSHVPRGDARGPKKDFRVIFLTIFCRQNRTFWYQSGQIDRELRSSHLVERHNSRYTWHSTLRGVRLVSMLHSMSRLKVLAFVIMCQYNGDSIP